ncbi:MAG: hypothetical protein ACRDKT_15400, partial [Actinomycetota bacterium]
EVGGAVDISGNTAATGIDLSALTSAGDSVDISGNTAATGIDLSALTSVDGDLTAADNGLCTEVTVGSLSELTGDLDVESCGDGTFTPGPVSPGGDTELDTEGYETVAGTTAAGSTTVETAHAEATMRAQIPGAAFVTPVAFEITRIAPTTLPPEEGTAPDGGMATIDPIAAYEFGFAVPTLNHDATLSFEILLDGLDDATRAAFLAALDAGTATLATRGDAPDATYQAFPLCGGSETPTADGCVQVELLDATGVATTGTPASVRFTGVVGHFSTWAVAIVDEPSPPPILTLPPIISPPPTITVPDDIVVDATSPAGAIVEFVATAHDDVDGTTPADCEPASGSMFPVGTRGLATVATTVTCGKTDSDGNVAVARSFSVTVRGAFDQLSDLRKLVRTAVTYRPMRLELVRRLDAVVSELQRDHRRRACVKLHGFIVKVRRAAAKDDPKIGEADAAALRAAARRIRSVLGC